MEKFIVREIDYDRPAKILNGLEVKDSYLNGNYRVILIARWYSSIYKFKETLKPYIKNGFIYKKDKIPLMGYLLWFLCADYFVLELSEKTPLSPLFKKLAASMGIYEFIFIHIDNINIYREIIDNYGKSGFLKISKELSDTFLADKKSLSYGVDTDSDFTDDFVERIYLGKNIDVDLKSVFWNIDMGI